jgi:hypothetical protein
MEVDKLEELRQHILNLKYTPVYEFIDSNNKDKLYQGYRSPSAKSYDYSISRSPRRRERSRSPSPPPLFKELVKRSRPSNTQVKTRYSICPIPIEKVQYSGRKYSKLTDRDLSLDKMIPVEELGVFAEHDIVIVSLVFYPFVQVPVIYL